ncbi:hypothetical protein QQS21_004436 [Conoideocrella luteorostrata]|uniref:Secreted protein n=1 Tax=Conoideocrella luteorostrata TaxID=1105319 RepID=A0AAJ0FZV2_9HYPO|nr:hypothetical protein QQS21_004436 [Conoideocrella luteorostrata]
MHLAQFSTLALFVLSAAAGPVDSPVDAEGRHAKPAVLGSRYPGAKCGTNGRAVQLVSGACNAVPRGSSVKITAKGTTCYTYKQQQCKGQGQRVSAPVKCHTLQSWGNPVSVKCVGKEKRHKEPKHPKDPNHPEDPNHPKHPKNPKNPKHPKHPTPDPDADDEE